MSVVPILLARLMFKDDTLDFRLLRLVLRSEMFACRLVFKPVSCVIDTELRFKDETLALSAIKLKLRSETL